MNAKEVGKILGLHPNTIYNGIREGTIPATKKGREWIVSDEWVNSVLSKEKRSKREKYLYFAIRELIVDKNFLVARLRNAMRTTVKSMDKLEEEFGFSGLMERVDYVLNENPMLCPKDPKLKKEWEKIKGIGIIPLMEELERIEHSIGEIKKHIKDYDPKETWDYGQWND